MCGPSGVGKSTLVKRLSAINGVYELAISYTTRELTDEEQTNKLYIHVTRQKFLQMLEREELIEWNLYEATGDYYGTPWSEFDRIFKAGKVPACDIDINGAIKIREQFLLYDTYMLYLDVNPDEQLRRLDQRNRPTDTAEKKQRRVAHGRAEKELTMKVQKAQPWMINEVKDYNNVIPDLYANELLNDLLRYKNTILAKTWVGHQCGFGKGVKTCPELLLTGTEFICRKKVLQFCGFEQVVNSTVACEGFDILRMESSMKQIHESQLRAEG